MTAAAPARVVVGRGLPAWTLRVAAAVTGSAMVLVPTFESSAWTALFVLGPVVLVAATTPASPVPAVAIVGAAVLLAIGGDDPLRPTVLVLIPVVHLFHVCCALAGVLPAGGRLHPSALRRPAVRFVVVQAAVFALAGVAALLPASRVPAALEVAALLALVLIALVVVVWHRRRGDQPHSGGGGHAGAGGATMEAWGEGMADRHGS